MKFAGSLDSLPLKWPRRKVRDVSTTEYTEANTLVKSEVYNFNIDRFGRYFLTSQIPSHSSSKCLIQEKGDFPYEKASNGKNFLSPKSICKQFVPDAQKDRGRSINVW